MAVASTHSSKHAPFLSNHYLLPHVLGILWYSAEVIGCNVQAFSWSYLST